MSGLKGGLCGLESEVFIIGRVSEWVGRWGVWVREWGVYDRAGE